MGLSISELHVRRSAWIREPPDVVWREFETMERLSNWFGTGHELEVYQPHLHGRIELSVDLDGARIGFGGNIIVFDSAVELSFTNNWFSDEAWSLDTFITFRLTPTFDGTLVELFHHGFERLGAEAADELEDYEAGWDNHHLISLREIVEGVNNPQESIH